MNPAHRPRAVVLLSGGLDSATCLAWAMQQYDCETLSFSYGQRHCSELDAAKRALEDRQMVEKAKGLLMRARGISE